MQLSALMHNVSSGANVHGGMSLRGLLDSRAFLIYIKERTTLVCSNVIKTKTTPLKLLMLSTR